MVEVTASDGSKFVVSDIDAEYVTRYSWHRHSGGYLVRKNGDKQEYLHRLITMARHSEFVDHIDGDPSNNQRENLRVVTARQNGYNTKLKRSNTSGYKGVSYYHNKWRAYISVDRKHIHLGTFSSREEAALAYNAAAIKYFGEFARLNNVLGG